MTTLLLLAITILFRTAAVDPKTGEAILDPVLAAQIRVEQIAGPVAAKGEVLACELINHPEGRMDFPDEKNVYVGPWSELKCKNGARYKIGPVRFMGQ